MRFIHFAASYTAAALMITATALSAQDVPPGVNVDRVTLHAGDTKAFTLQPGNTHQLLVSTNDRNAKGVIVAHYEASAAGSVLTVTSKTGNTMAFTILADRNGDGGYKPAGKVDNLPGNGSAVTTRWAMNMGTINVGDFVGGPAPLKTP